MSLAFCHVFVVFRTKEPVVVLNRAGSWLGKARRSLVEFLLDKYDITLHALMFEMSSYECNTNVSLLTDISVLTMDDCSIMLVFFSFLSFR